MDTLNFWNASLDDPALEPPAGVDPTLGVKCTNHSLGHGVILSGIMVSSLSVILRLITSYMKKKLGLADAFMVLAWVQYLAFAGILYKGASQRGIPCHQWDYLVSDYSDFLYVVHVASIIYAPCMICLKTAILVDWTHLFCPTGRDRMWWVIQFMIWGNIIFYVVGAFAEIFQCYPAEKIWNVKYEGPGYCIIKIAANDFSGALINVISDLCILALPNWRVWRLSRNFTVKKKIGISVLFATGILVCVFGTLRLVGLIPLIDSADVTYWVGLLALYSCLEMGFGFLIIALPFTPLIFNTMLASRSLQILLRSLTDSYGQWTGRGTAPRSPAPSSRYHGSEEIKRPRLRGVWSITELKETQKENSRVADRPGSDTCSNEPTRQGSAMSEGHNLTKPKKRLTGSDLV